MVALCLWAVFDRTSWNEDFTMEDGRRGVANFTYLEWRFWGGHVISVGGGTIAGSGTFRTGNHRSHWTSTRDERVYSVQFSQEKQRWYALSLDRTDITRKIVIRFYGGKDGELLKEIEPRDYPLKLAIQNLWLDDEVVEALSDVFNIIQSDVWARRSLPARTWWKVLHGEDIEEVPLGFIDQIAAQEFPGRRNFLPPASELPQKPK